MESSPLVALARCSAGPGKLPRVSFSDRLDEERDAAESVVPNPSCRHPSLLDRLPSFQRLLAPGATV